MTSNRHVVNAAAGAIVAAFFLALLYLLQHTVSSFLLAFVLAYLFDPFVVWLEGKNIRRIYAIVALYAVLAVFALFCVAFIIPFFSLRWQAFLHDLPLYIQKVKVMVLNLKGKPVPYAEEESQWLFEKGSETLDNLLTKLGAGVYATATRVVFNLLNLVLAPVLIFFMLVYKKSTFCFIDAWLPAAHRDEIVSIGRDINRSMGGFIRGQLIVSAIVAVLVTGALLVLDVDYPFFNGIFAGLSSVLPFIGVVLAMIPPLFFGYVKYQNGMILVKILASFGIIYFFEGYVAKPLVFKESMDLNPLVTILMVMAFGELLGFWGIILAIPIAASVKIITEHILRRRGNRECLPL